MTKNGQPHRIVIVGGGAGGLELASRVGDTLGKSGRAHITLVDPWLTHLWKPLLHEVAAGTLDSHDDELDFLAQARWHHLRFRLGRMNGLDRQNRQVKLAPIYNEAGWEMVPGRTFPYDTLVVSVGGVSNDFGIPSVPEHFVYLDNRQQADYFHELFLQNCIRVQTQSEPPSENQLNVAIVGGGATGVELAAELHAASRQLVAYGLDRISPERDVKLTLVEATDRLLPALPERLSRSTEERLRGLGIEIYTNERVTEATEEGIYTNTGRFISARMKVWAAGIKAPDFLRDLEGLETDRLNRLVVRPTLQTTRDDAIFALGDCSHCPQPGTDQPVPPRAQAASQQASLLVKGLKYRLEGKPLPEFRYKDRGSLIALSRYDTIGNLMGNLTGSVTVEGWLAYLMYRSLYRIHQRAIYGLPRTLFLVLKDWLQRRTGPQMKLH